MGQAPPHVGQAREEDGVVLVMVVCQEDELVPLIWLTPVLQQLVQSTPLLRGGQTDHRLAQVGRPVRLAEAEQHVGRRELDLVICRPDRRAEPYIPEFTLATGITGWYVALELF